MYLLVTNLLLHLLTLPEYHGCIAAVWHKLQGEACASFVGSTTQLFTTLVAAQRAALAAPFADLSVPGVFDTSCDGKGYAVDCRTRQHCPRTDGDGRIVHTSNEYTLTLV